MANEKRVGKATNNLVNPYVFRDIGLLTRQLVNSSTRPLIFLLTPLSLDISLPKP